MNLEITSRHFSASDKLKVFIENKVNKFIKYDYKDINFHIVLTKEKKTENVEIDVHIKGNHFSAHDSSEKFEISVTNSFNKIATQIKKYHDKMIGR